MTTRLLSILILLFTANTDTSEISKLIKRSAEFNLENNPDSSFVIANKALELAMIAEDSRLQASAEYQIGKSYMLQADYTSSMSHILKASEIYKANNDSLGIAQSNLQLGLIEYIQKNFLDAFPYFNTTFEIADKLQNKKLSSTACYLIGRIYLETDQLQKADMLLNLAIKVKKEIGNEQGYYECLSAIAELNYKKGNYADSKKLYNECIDYFTKSDNPNGLAICQYGLANTLYKTHNLDSALIHYNISYKLSVENKYRDGLLKSTKSLAEFYKNQNNYEKAFEFSEQYHLTHDSLFNTENTRKLTKLQYQLSLAQKQLEIIDLNKKKEKDQWILLFMCSTTLCLIILTIVLYRNNRFKQKSNKELEQALIELKNTQQQLIRSEKLASLGQLTAGVAHELKNPLNFIINFSEYSSELLDELQEWSSDEKKQMTDELKSNLKKIQSHGLRANSIITNMMMHARTAEQNKTITNLTPIIQENIDLAYQATRASNLSFHCKVKSNIAKEIIKVNIIQQEIARTILNILNNSFYATSLRIGTDGYEPEVKINLSKEGNSAVISIEDNGIGMDEITMSRIFEPFFTTKPTGEGTGLGLSMSYDMIQSNGGTLAVESELDNYTRFTITLPVVE